jgi:hypothetical protein
VVYLRRVDGINRVLVAVHVLVSQIESGDDQVGKRNLEYQEPGSVPMLNTKR